MTTFVTPVPWLRPGKRVYGTEITYRLTAKWLAPCVEVADWGGGGGHFSTYLKKGQRYTRIDGTAQPGVGTFVLADLATYHVPSDGILLRHVVDMTHDWRRVLDNALAAFRQRLAVVTWTPFADQTVVAGVKRGWPILNFNESELRAAIGDVLVYVDTAHDPQRKLYEHVYYCEKRP